MSETILIGLGHFVVI